jgi:hypothetical protein
MASLTEQVIDGEDLMGDASGACYLDTGDPVTVGDRCYMVISDTIGQAYFSCKRAAMQFYGEIAND